MLGCSEQGKDLSPHRTGTCSRNRLWLHRDFQDGSVLRPGAGQKVSTTGLQNSDSLFFFPFTLKRFMICRCFIPFMVQKERSRREFQLRDSPRNHLLPRPGGMPDSTRYSNGPTKLRAFTTWIPQHQAMRAPLPGTAGLSPASTLRLPPHALHLRGGISQKRRRSRGREEIPSGASLLSDSVREIVSDPTFALFMCSSWLPTPTSPPSTDQNPLPSMISSGLDSDLPTAHEAPAFAPFRFGSWQWKGQSCLLPARTEPPDPWGSACAGWALEQ